MIRRLPATIAVVAVLGIWPLDCEAVMFLETGDIQHNTSTPGDNSGWQYEGKFMSFLGVPISPHHFITAKHFGGSVGEKFDLHGDLYTTVGYIDSPTTDLRIWEVSHAKPFPTYAPVITSPVTPGTLATIFGRGKRRGDPVDVMGVPKGWMWGDSDDVKRWGRNQVFILGNFISGYGELISFEFNNPGVPNECHLAVGDSGGGVFVMEQGLWKLAGINLAVEGPFRKSLSDPVFDGVIFDKGGLFEYGLPDYTLVTDTETDIPTQFVCTHLFPVLGWIDDEERVPEITSLANENFAAWRKLYFTPAQIAAPAVTGPLADADADGISNILEFALNLDPIFNERATMTAATGLRGLPLVRVEPDGGNDRLTIEFVRRTAGSGAGLTYVHQFSSNLETWESVGTETITAINPRWERVKIVDSETNASAPLRHSRIKVVMAD